MISIASFRVQAVFCAISGSRDISKTYWVSDLKNTKYCITTVLGKKGPARKGYFWSQTNVFYVIFFFSCVKIVFCELMLLDLGDLLVAND